MNPKKRFSDLNRDLFSSPIVDLVTVIEDFDAQIEINNIFNPLISLKKGDVVRITKKNDKWWRGKK